MTADLVLMPEPLARAALAGRTLSLRLLTPPYPALGLGRLRLVRLHERGTITEMLCSYEGYARIEGD
jgi:hypothetical protein